MTAAHLVFDPTADSADTFALRVHTRDRDLAHRLASALQDLLEPTPAALSVFATDAPLTSPARPGENATVQKSWQLEAFYDLAPAPDVLHAAAQEVLGQDLPIFQAVQIPRKNWVAVSQAALPPVHAGRFTVFGSHDAHLIGRRLMGIQIDAGEAFGTAHHATTTGCLLEITRWCSKNAGRRVRALDLGCGSGILAIALSKAAPHALISASDIDFRSCEVADDNLFTNHVARGRVMVVCAAGLPSTGSSRSGHNGNGYDLIVANILAAPLIELAADLRRAVRKGGELILSGLLNTQAPQVIAAYCTAGFAVKNHRRIGEWSTLRLIKRSAH
ncbi:MAG: 50S ribosomal protein L11 methyltransferase [Pseudomonadota bacterium]